VSDLGVNYGVQFGNESGNGSENMEGKILRLEGRYEQKKGLALEGYYSYATRPKGQDRHTAQGMAGYRLEAGRIGGQYVWQERKSGEPGVADQTISIWSGFGVWDFLPKQADAFLRVDNVKGHMGDVETGLPGATGIDYVLLSDQSPFTTWIFGAEAYLHPSVRLSPNVEIISYSHDPDPVNNPGRSKDAIFRLTFFWAF
jgi:hypothetical protein